MSPLNIYRTCCTFALTVTTFAPRFGLLFTYPEQTKALVTVHLLLQHQDYGIHCLITFLLPSPLDNSKDCWNITCSINCIILCMFNTLLHVFRCSCLFALCIPGKRCFTNACFIVLLFIYLLFYHLLLLLNVSYPLLLCTVHDCPMTVSDLVFCITLYLWILNLNRLHPLGHTTHNHSPSPLMPHLALNCMLQTIKRLCTNFTVYYHVSDSFAHRRMGTKSLAGIVLLMFHAAVIQCSRKYIPYFY